MHRFIAVFDQALIHPDDHHLLRVDDAAYPEEFRGVLRRLHQAMSEEEIRQKMIVEDEIVTEFEERDRREQRRLREEERLQKEAALAELAELKRRLERLD